MSEPDRPIPVPLTRAEARELLRLIDHGTEVLQPATRVAAEKFRAALLEQGSDAVLDDARSTERTRLP